MSPLRGRKRSFLARPNAAIAHDGNFTLPHVRRGQRHQLVRRLRRLRDERAAVAVGCGDKACGHEAAEKRDFRDVGSLP